MQGRPSGTLTFLFTDIEGSTRLWEQHPQLMKTALTEHDRIVRRTVEGHRGFVFSVTGDGFSVAFDNPVEAVEAAADAQQALREHHWGAVGDMPVRMALDTGIADERDGEYYGPPLNRTARILEHCHAGDVVCSATTAHLVRSELPEKYAVQRVGRRHLRDVPEPEYLYRITPGDTGPKQATRRRRRVVAVATPIVAALAAVALYVLPASNPPSTPLRPEQDEVISPQAPTTVTAPVVEPPPTTVAYEPTEQPAVAWSVDIPGCPDRHGCAPATLAAGREPFVYANHAARLVAVNAADGSVEWSTGRGEEPNPYATESVVGQLTEDPVIVTKDTVVVLTEAGATSFDATDGHVVWEYISHGTDLAEDPRTGEPVEVEARWSDTLVDGGGTLFVHTFGLATTAVDTATGEVLWQRPIRVEAVSAWESESRTAVDLLAGDYADEAATLLEVSAATGDTLDELGSWGWDEYPYRGRWLSPPWIPASQAASDQAVEPVYWRHDKSGGMPESTWSVTTVDPSAALYFLDTEPSGLTSLPSRTLLLLVENETDELVVVDTETGGSAHLAVTLDGRVDEWPVIRRPRTAPGEAPAYNVLIVDKATDPFGRATGPATLRSFVTTDFTDIHEVWNYPFDQNISAPLAVSDDVLIVATASAFGASGSVVALEAP